MVLLVHNGAGYLGARQRLDDVVHVIRQRAGSKLRGRCLGLPVAPIRGRLLPQRAAHRERVRKQLVQRHDDKVKERELVAWRHQSIAVSVHEEGYRHLILALKIALGEKLLLQRLAPEQVRGETRRAAAKVRALQGHLQHQRDVARDRLVERIVAGLCHRKASTEIAHEVKVPGHVGGQHHVDDDALQLYPVRAPQPGPLQEVVHRIAQQL
mmetsp:Transcript_41620/g.105435  ORF Transcript_41620/g.105435 Transcript_41620/m.105435 type:complete len:211 (+) Transcript_41620:508-1140(+)